MIARLRPLSVRAGARFACVGDGLCCTDVHLLGPVARAERAPIEEARPGAIVRGRRLAVLAPKDNGHCTFHADDMRCAIHSSRLLPRSCTRYPFLLAATPTGARIGTDHRCPCRTMGERPLLRIEDALPSLLDRRGRLSVDRRIEGRIPIERRRHVSFTRYEGIEGERLGRISEPLNLGGKRWQALAWRMDEIARAPTRWGAMHAAFARGIEAVAERREVVPFARPWAESFARAAARSVVVRDPEEMLCDWAADVIWALEWTFSMSLTDAEAEIGLRAEIARALARSIGTRVDAAMAEAIAIVEVAGLSEDWISFVRQ